MKNIVYIALLFSLSAYPTEASEKSIEDIQKLPVAKFVHTTPPSPEQEKNIKDQSVNKLFPPPDNQEKIPSQDSQTLPAVLYLDPKILTEDIFFEICKNFGRHEVCNARLVNKDFQTFIDISNQLWQKYYGDLQLPNSDSRKDYRSLVQNYFKPKLNYYKLHDLTSIEPIAIAREGMTIIGQSNDISRNSKNDKKLWIWKLPTQQQAQEFLCLQTPTIDIEEDGWPVPLLQFEGISSHNQNTILGKIIHPTKRYIQWKRENLELTLDSEREEREKQGNYNEDERFIKDQENIKDLKENYSKLERKDFDPDFPPNFTENNISSSSDIIIGIAGISMDHCIKVGSIHHPGDHNRDIAVIRNKQEKYQALQPYFQKYCPKNLGNRSLEAPLEEALCVSPDGSEIVGIAAKNRNLFVAHKPRLDLF